MADVVGGSIVWNLDVDTKTFDSGMQKAKATAKDTASTLDSSFKTATKSMNASLDSVSSSLNETGNSFVKFGAIPAAALGIATATAVKFEDSMADVRKTTGLSAEDTEKLGMSILELGKNTRTANSELIDIAKIAGQLGVSQAQLLPFIESVNQATVALGDEFTGGAEQVTKELGILANQFKLTGKDGENIAQAITQIGSSLNALGAAGQATAPYMTDFGNRVGGIAPTVGLSIDKVLGLAAALQELGQSPEVAGSAIQSLLVTMGKDVSAFAKVAGVSTKEFSRLLKDDINQALLLTATGVSKDADSVEILAKRLDGLGIAGQRTVGVLANLGNNTELVKKRQKLAAEELAKGTSLLSEYEIKNNTAAANMEKFKNRMNELSVTIGNAVIPGMVNMLDNITPIIDVFANFTKNNPQLVAGLLQIGSGFLALGLALKSLSFILSSYSGVIKLVAVLSKVETVTKLVAVAFNPIGLVIVGIIAVLGLLALAWKKNWGDIQGKTKAFVSGVVSVVKILQENMSKTWDTIKEKTGQFVTFIVSIPTLIQTAMNTLYTKIVSAFIALKTFFVDLYVSIVSFFVNLPKNIAYGLGLVFGIIATFIVGVGSYLATNVPLWIASIEKFFTELPAKVSTWLVNTITSIAQWTVDVANLLVEKVTGWYTTISTFFTELPSKVSAWLSQTATNIQTWATNAYTTFTNWITQTKDALTKFFSNLPNNVYSSLSDLGNKLKQAFIDAWNALYAEITSWPGRLTEWGKNIGTSFVEGIKNGLKGLGDAFKNGMNDGRAMVEGHSPPKEGPYKDIDTWGYNIGKAWIGGMQEAMSGLQIPTMGMPRMGQSALPQQQPQQTAQTFNITIQADISKDMDIKRLVERLQWEVSKQGLL